MTDAFLFVTIRHSKALRVIPAPFFSLFSIPLPLFLYNTIAASRLPEWKMTASLPLTSTVEGMNGLDIKD